MECQHGPARSRPDPVGPSSSHMDPHGPARAQPDPVGPSSSHLDPPGSPLAHPSRQVRHLIPTEIIILSATDPV